MITLKEKILELKSKGLKQSEIAKELKISTGTVSYHCNPEVKKKAIKNKRIRNLKKTKNVDLNLLNKELNYSREKVCWKQAEAIINAKLISLGYDTFIPFNTGGEIDLLAVKDNNILKLQVKSITPKNDCICFSFRRKSSNYKKVVSKPYENIDYFLLYDGINIFVVSNENNIKSITLRYKIPKNNQENIFMASDYLINEKSFQKN